MRDREGEHMRTIISIIIWSALSYLCGRSDGSEESYKGLMKLIIYVLLMIGMVIVGTLIYEKGEFI